MSAAGKGMDDPTTAHAGVRRRAALLLALLVLAAAPTLTARAAAPVATTIVAMLVPSNQESQVDDVVRALQGQLADLPVALQLTRVEAVADEAEGRAEMARAVARGTGAAIVFWYDVSPPASVSLYVCNHDGRPPVVRPVDGVETEAKLETLALIVRGSVRAALDRGDGKADDHAPQTEDQNTPRSEVEIPLSGPEKIKSPDERGLFDLELAYAFESFSADSPASHAMGFALAIRLHEQWALLLEYRHFFGAVEGESTLVATRLRRHPFSLGARFRWPLGRFELGADLLATLDYQEMNTWAPGVRLNPDQSDFAFSMSPMLRATVRVFTRVRLFLTTGAEIFFSQQKYGVRGTTSRTVLLDPWPVRPRLMLGVSAEIF